MASDVSKHQNSLESLFPVQVPPFLILQAWDGPGICFLTGPLVILRLGFLDCSWRYSVCLLPGRTVAFGIKPKLLAMWSGTLHLDITPSYLYLCTPPLACPGELGLFVPSVLMPVSLLNFLLA